MLNINFNLSDKSNPKKHTPVVAFMRWGGHTVKMSTGQKVLPANWSDKKQKAKGEGAETVNYNLARFESVARKAYDQLAKGKVPEKTELRDAVREMYKGEGKKESVTFVQYVGDYAENRKDLEVSTDVYTSTQKLIIEFSELKNKSCSFHEMDVKFVRDFVGFMFERNMTPGYVRNIVVTIKRVLRNAHAEGITNARHYESPFFKSNVKAVDKQDVYLNKKELSLIYELELEKDSTADRIRDIFLIGCYTGLRISDYSKLLEENIYILPNGKRAFKVKSKKTRQDVVVPISYRVSAILDKRNGKLPKPFSISWINKHIRGIAKLAGIDNEVLQTSYNGNTPLTRKRKKYELISSHTARRSFATNAVLDGVPYHWIMKITGHKSVANFEKYVKMSGEEAAVLLSNHSFFIDE